MRFLVTPFVPGHQAVSLVNSSAPGRAAVDQGFSEFGKVCAIRAFTALVSLGMLILSEFQAFEPTQGMLRMHHLAPRPGISAFSGVGCMVGCLVSKCKRCTEVVQALELPRTYSKRLVENL